MKGVFVLTLMEDCWVELKSRCLYLPASVVMPMSNDPLYSELTLRRKACGELVVTRGCGELVVTRGCGEVPVS